MTHFETAMENARLPKCTHPDRKALLTCTRCFQELALAFYAAGEMGMVDALTHLLDTGALTKVAEETAALAKEGVDPKAVKGGFLAGAITVIEAARATAARPVAEVLLLEKMRQPRPCPHCPGDGKTCAPRHRYPG